MARSPAVVWVVVVLVVAGAGGVGVHRSQVEARQAAGLLSETLVAAGLEVRDLDRVGGFRRSPDCPGLPPERAWSGGQMVTQSHDLVDWTAAGEAVAKHYEREGWSVRRWVSTLPTHDEKVVLADHVDELVWVRLDPQQIIVTAHIGPCLSDDIRDDDPPTGRSPRWPRDVTRVSAVPDPSCEVVA